VNADVTMPQLGESATVSAPPPQHSASRIAHAAPIGGLSGGPRHRHSPLIRRLAREAGVHLDRLVGTGPKGRVTRADVAEAAATQERASITVSDTSSAAPLHVSAQPTCVVEVDLSNVVALRDRYAAARRDRSGASLDDGQEGPLTLTAFFVDAVVQALRAYPLLNASIDSDGRTVHHDGRQHIGVTVDTDNGVVVPIINDAGDLNLRGLSRRIGDVTARAQRGALRPDDLAGGTFTVSTAGGRGALFETPILMSGHVGALATGDIVERAVVVRRAHGERAIAIRAMAYVALTYDRRLIDGAVAAKFLTLVKERLQGESPASELS
jgi:pyruvate dehydrogenase E2 component (dihydrolipoamide acetyltransferase)